ncbi:MAG: bifunctional folylpolyglutamate synthase/dihydrofolate synthase [Kiritimatiellia bacterium]
MNETREQRLQALFARTHAGIKPGLELTQELLCKLGDPQRQFLSVHVAGTNGKGSTCALLESGLMQCGLKTGLFTSPHLIRVNERIRINGLPVTDEAFDQALNQIQSVEGSLSRPPTFFETLTVMAFLIFAREGVQVAVVETGMGGRLDSTNVVEPLLSAITRVDFDHMAYLGNTLELIAGEKAGIIKPGRPVVIGAQAGAARRVLIQRAETQNSAWKCAEEWVTLSGHRQSLEGQRLSLSSGRMEYGRLRYPLLGSYQLENLATAVTALEWVEELLGLAPDAGRMQRAVQQVNWSGRGQVLSCDPPLILDVAHNEGGARALRNLLRELFGKKAKGVLFWAGLADKSPEKFIQVMRPVLSGCICMPLHSARAMAAEDLQKLCGAAGLPGRVMDLQSAREQIRNLIGEADFGCVAGSVYLGGEWLAGGEVDDGEGSRTS